MSAPLVTVPNALFARFVTFDRHGGSGLGLSIARELAQLQGGDLSYVPHAFTLTIPAT